MAEVVPPCMQDSVAQSAGLPAMVQMLAMPDDERRCSAMWALANLIHAASPAVCDAVMAALPWNQFVPLLQDTNSCVQVSSLAERSNQIPDKCLTSNVFDFVGKGSNASSDSFASSRFDVVSYRAC